MKQINDKSIDELDTEITEKVIKTIQKIFTIAFCVVIVIFIAGGIYTSVKSSPVDPDNTETVDFVIESGWGVNKVISELKSKDFIKDELVFKVLAKVYKKDSFYAGTYKLSKSYDATKIMKIISSTNSIENDSIEVRFIEGKRFPYYVKKIAENFDYTEEEIMDKTTNKEYLNTLINKYWFITDDILNSSIYYPLEGYLFADTYSFKKSSTIEEIIEKMLDQMDAKLTPYKEEINVSNLKVHGLLTLASMVELEAVTAEDRQMVAGVFTNRLKEGMTLGSDVTTYYAAKKEMTQSLTMSDINGCNAYNTRGTCVSGLPVGPICAPSYSSIVAAIEPKENNYLYFVADSENKVYYAENASEHNKNISNLRNNGKWSE